MDIRSLSALLRMAQALRSCAKAQAPWPPPPLAGAAAAEAPAAGQQLVRIHGEYLQCDCDTGRLAMREPSLQVVPKPVTYELQQTQVGLGVVPGGGGGGSSRGVGT
jgi:hypothetical protein